MRSRRVRALTAIAAFMLLAAACGDDDDDTTSAGTDTETDDTATAPTAGDESEGGETASDSAVDVVSTDLGDVLASGGRTLYIFMPDNAGDPTCYDECAQNWPPAVVDGEASAGDGVDASLLGTVARTDGSEQLTVNGWPVYHFAQDDDEEDIYGQGIGGVWFLVGSDGNAIETTPTTTG